MTRLLAILCPVLLITSCAPKALVVPPAPAKVAKVAPQARGVREGLTDADYKAIAIREAAKEGSLLATKARQDAERLKEAKTATEQELTKLWHDLQTVEARNLFLEQETARLSAHLSATLLKAVELEDTANAKDAEVTALRDRFDHLGRVATEAIEREKDAVAAVNRLRGEIWIYRWIAIALGVLILLWILKKVFLPPGIR